MHRQYDEARARANKKIGFYKHLKVYVFVNVLMAILHASTGQDGGWLATPFFWGIGLFFHYVRVFGLPGTGGLYSEDWEKRIYEEELEQLQREEEEMDRLELRQRKKQKRKAWDDNELV